MFWRILVFIITGLIFLISLFFNSWLLILFILLLFFGIWYFFENLSLFAFSLFYFMPQFLLFNKAKDFYPGWVLLAVLFTFIIFSYLILKQKTNQLDFLFYLAAFIWFLTLSIFYFDLVIPFWLIIIMNFLYILGISRLQVFIENKPHSPNGLFILNLIFQEYLWLLFFFPLTSFSQAVILTLGYILLIQLIILRRPALD